MKRKRQPDPVLWPCDDAAESIVSFLCPVELREVMTVNRACYNALKDTKLASQTILAQVRRALERQTCGPWPDSWPSELYLSGSLLLQVLYGAAWQPNDVDLFVPNVPALIHNAQRFLVTAGYRIAQCSRRNGPTYGNMPVEGIIAWERVTEAERGEIVVPVDSDEPDLIPDADTVPIAWTDGGLYSYSLTSMRANVDPEWVPACARSVGQGLSVQLVIMGAKDTTLPWSQLLDFDLPILENVFDGKTVRVSRPEDVFNACTSARLLPYSLQHNKWAVVRRKERLARYRSRGIYIMERMSFV